MQLTGYFVEYLIIGSLSLLWLLPLLEELHISFPDNTGVIVLLAPSLYAIGMIVDVVGHYVTLFHRRRIRKKAKAKYGRRYGITKIEYATIDVDLVSVNPDLAKEAAKRTTRTRVARGALINAICAFPIWITISWSKLSILQISLLIGGGVLSIIALWFIWARWQNITYRFETKALSKIKQTIELDKHGNR